jgi:hypothetical protein
MGVLKNKSFRSDSADLTGLSDLAGWISLLDSCGIDSFLWQALFTDDYKDWGIGKIFGLFFLSVHGSISVAAVFFYANTVPAISRTPSLK